jgi:CxxC-x17-CxxC domain-containing protein
MWYNTAMGNFGRDDRGSGGFRGGFNRGGDRGGFSRGRSSFGGGRSFDRGGGRGDRPMYKATCSNCGKECEVPFRPTNGKPVYCSDCFEKMGGGRGDAQRPERSDFSPQGQDQNKTQLDALNAKLDRILGILEPKTAPVILTPVEKEVKEIVKEVKTPKVKKSVKKATSPKKE